MKKILIRIVEVMLVLAGLQAAFGVAMRSQRTRDTVRAFNKRTLNPWMMKRAGKGNWYASVIETEGRSSHRTYRTPIVADPVAGGFVIPLPYGQEVDWLLNAQAAGRAVIVHHDVGYPVSGFEILTADEAGVMLPWGRRTSFRLNGIEEFLRVRLVEHAGVTTVSV